LYIERTESPLSFGFPRATVFSSRPRGSDCRCYLKLYMSDFDCT